jgi:hypothetical protein
VAKRSGTRGDRRRNGRIEAVRAVVRPDRAILAIDLGEDKQVAALLDHDGRVLGRRVLSGAPTRRAYSSMYATSSSGRLTLPFIPAMLLAVLPLMGI